MRYLLLIGGNDKNAAPPSPAASQAMVQAFMRFSEEVRKAGKTVVSERLRPEDQATRVRVKGGHHQITDGPFAETKEALGGFYVLEYARVVASVLRIVRDIDTAEDVVQEAFAQALDRWPTTGAPERPGAWLLTAARRRAIDRLRRARLADGRADAVAYETALGASDERPNVADPETIPD